MPPRWLRVSRRVRFPVGYGLTGSGGRQREPEAGARGKSTAAGPGGDAVEPATAATADSREHHERPTDAGPPRARQRVVLLPHAQIEPPDTRPTTARTRKDHRHEPRRFPAAIPGRRQHPVGDNAPPTWDRGPSHSARPLLHLLPYPRPRRQGRAVLRSHIGSGSVPGTRGKHSKPRQITG
jgi:hypothetical protein